MKFDPERLREFVTDNNALKREAVYRERVFKQLDEKDITIAAFKLCECRIPVGLRGISLLLDNDKNGLTELHRVWRYTAYACHVRLRYGDWIRDRIDKGETPECDVPSLMMEDAAYAIAGAIALGEIEFAQWLGKRAVASFMRPEVFGPVFWQEEPIVPYVLGLFLHWTVARSGMSPDDMAQVIGDLSKQCSKPYAGRLLTQWNGKTFDKHFTTLCDNWGEWHSEPTPFQGFPVAVVATRLIRREAQLSVPDHPLLDHPVCALALEGCDGSTDSLFDEVNEKLAAIAPTDEFLWPW